MGKQFANRDVSKLIIDKINSDGTTEPFAFVDYANVTAVDMTGEVVYAYGGQGHPKKVAFSGDRGGTLRVESQISDGNLYSMLTGATVETTASYITRAEATAASANTVTLGSGDSAPISADGITVFLKADDLETPLSGPYTLNSKTITANTSGGATGWAQGAELVIYYFETLSDVVKLNLKSTTFPKAVRIYGETWDKDENDQIIEEHMIAYKATPQPAFTISNQNTGDPGTITITYDLLEDKDKNIFDLIFVDEN